MTDVWLNMQYEVTKLPTRFEAEAVLHWYASTGYYRVNAVGFGATVEEAKKQASLMLGQARAALHIALIENRVPEAAIAAGRHDNPTPQSLG